MRFLVPRRSYDGMSALKESSLHTGKFLFDVIVYRLFVVITERFSGTLYAPKINYVTRF